MFVFVYILKSTAIKDYNSEHNLQESASYLAIDTLDELDSKINKNMTISHERNKKV